MSDYQLEAQAEMWDAIASQDDSEAQRAAEKTKTRNFGGWNVTCDRCDRSFSSSADFHTHVAQGCK